VLTEILEGMYMINLSNTTAAFLRRGNDYLLMKRAPNREIAPDLWSGVGGKLEREELNDPLSACLREIYEETGITASQIHNLTLRYLVIRRYKDTIRQSYIYFGEANAEPSIVSDEGELHWISEGELLNRRYTATFAAMLEHFICNSNEKCVIVGIAENDNGNCRMVWSALDDFEK